MEAELSNLGGEVMAGQQLQVCLPLFQHMLFGIHLYQEFSVHPPSQTCIAFADSNTLQALTASEGDVLLTYSNGQQFQL